MERRSHIIQACKVVCKVHVHELRVYTLSYNYVLIMIREVHTNIILHAQIFITDCIPDTCNIMASLHGTTSVQVHLYSILFASFSFKPLNSILSVRVQFVVAGTQVHFNHCTC